MNSEHTLSGKRLYLNMILLALTIAVSGCAARAPHTKTDGVLLQGGKILKGARYVPLRGLCDSYGLNWSWDNVSRVAVLKGRGNRITLREGGRIILVNGSPRQLGKPAMLVGGALYVPASFETEILEGEAAGPGEKKFVIRTVALDAGHGGKNLGAVSRAMGLREKDLTLGIARRLKAALERDGLNVILTRSSDVFISLDERCAIANEKKADLFVSIHANASRAKQARGFECYYLSDGVDDNARAEEASRETPFKPEGSPEPLSGDINITLWDMALTENRIESRELAASICASAGGEPSARNRGVKSARFHVLKGTRMPAVLVEVGFLTNSVEAKRMREPGYIDRISSALERGIIHYKNEFERTDGFTA